MGRFGLLLVVAQMFSGTAVFAQAPLEIFQSPGPNLLFDFIEPQHTDFNLFNGRSNSLTKEQLEQISLQLSLAARSQMAQYSSIASGEFPGCVSGAEYLRALRVLGRATECLMLARICDAPSAGEGERDLIFEGARCAQDLGDLQDARNAYDSVTTSEALLDRNYKARVLQFAQFVHFSQYSHMTRQVLSREPSWSNSTEKVLGAIEVIQNGSSELIAKPDAEVFWQGEIDSAAGSGARYLVQNLKAHWMRYLAAKNYRFDDAAQFIMDHVSDLVEPQSWAPFAYMSLYSQDQQHFRLARRIYDALKGFESRSLWLPLEQNTYTYTELYNSVCRSSLTQDRDFRDYSEIKRHWQNGRITISEALRRIEVLISKSPTPKADLLTFKGSLLGMLDREQEAMESYWQAHEACRYSHRSHWGMRNILQRWNVKQFEDYNQHLEKVDRVLAEIEFPSALDNFVINWKSLSELAQKRVKFALRIWAKHINFMNEAGYRVYIKSAHEILSESPGLAGMRDLRIGPPNYPRDNRLWDDVRGLGGVTAVADYDETMLAPFGAYNLLGHEIAHQFHFALAQNQVARCITKLYQEAKERNVFADPYAAGNEHEYFAQGVGYFLIPEDSPTRFGLNVRWLKANDPQLFTLIEKIENTSNIAEIQCP